MKLACIDCSAPIKLYTAQRCKSCATRHRYKTMLPEKRKALAKAISARMMGNKHSPLAILKNRLAHFGRKQSPDTVAKRKATMSSWSKERKELWLQRISAALSGPNSYRWKGGKTPHNTKIRTSREYRYWRDAVFARDCYTCNLCGLKSGNGKAVTLNADHIKPFALFPELRFDISNGRTLCIDCHKTTPNYGGKAVTYYKTYHENYA